MKKLMVILLAILFCSCSEEVKFTDDINNSMAIYLVKEVDQDHFNPELKIESLELEEEPWIKPGDIAFYDWSAHSFFLNKEIEKAQYSGRYFVVTSNEKRLLAGVLWPMILSSLPACPSVCPEDGVFYPKDVFMFGHFGSHRPGDLDGKGSFKSSLIFAGLYRKGIVVELNGIEKINSKSIRYRVKVSNVDKENIFVPDPDKMGASNFHYYSNGVSFQKGDNYYWARDAETEPSDKIKPEWFTKLSPGNSITRTITLSGYNDLPSGTAKASFRFPGGEIKTSGDWNKPDGRIWLGTYVVEREIKF